MKKLLIILTAILITLLSTALPINASIDPFMVEGILTELGNVEEMLEYRATKKWVNEPWYSDEYFDQKINYICFMDYFLYVPNGYTRADITNIWIDDFKVIIFLKDGGKISYAFRDSIDSDIHLPFIFYFSKSGDTNYTKLSENDVQNVMADIDRVIYYGGPNLSFSSADEMIKYIKAEKWENELWYHPACEDKMVIYMQKYLSKYLFAPVEYSKKDINEIDFFNNTVSIVFNDGECISYKYSVFDKAAAIPTSTFKLADREMYNIISTDSTIDIIEPVEQCNLICE